MIKKIIKNLLLSLIIFWPSYLSIVFNISFAADFIGSLLTVFSIIFGFYITWFSVFLWSRYLNKLYQIQNETDNRKTLLDDLLQIFKNSTYYILFCLVFLLTIHFAILNEYNSLLWLLIEGFTFWLVIVAFIKFIYTIHIFIQVVRKSAIHSE